MPSYVTLLREYWRGEESVRLQSPKKELVVCLVYSTIQVTVQYWLFFNSQSTTFYLEKSEYNIFTIIIFLQTSLHFMKVLTVLGLILKQRQKEMYG